MSEDKNMSINVYTNQKEELLSSNKMSEEYIVRVNEQLSNLNMEYIKDIESVRSYNCILEEEVDKQEVSIRYMRGMLKNFVELKELYIKKNNKLGDINKLVETRVNNSEVFMENMKKTFNMIMGLYIFNNIVMCYVGLLDVSSFIRCLLNLIFCVIMCKDYNVTFSSKCNKRVIDSIRQGVKEDNEKIKEIEGGNDFLSDYIDSL
jgi:hypothetical protein